MADPELYRDGENWRRTSAEHGRLKEEIEALYARWEELQETAPEPS